MIFVPVLLYALILAIQYFLSKTGNKLIGAIIPVLFIITITYLYLSGQIGLNLIGTIIFGIIGLLFLFGQWDNAQKSKKKQAQLEMDKMKRKDLS